MKVDKEEMIVDAIKTWATKKGEEKNYYLTLFNDATSLSMAICGALDTLDMKIIRGIRDVIMEFREEATEVYIVDLKNDIMAARLLLAIVENVPGVLNEPK